jgi:hypothetical protein
MKISADFGKITKSAEIFFITFLIKDAQKWVVIALIFAENCEKQLLTINEKYFRW